MEDDKQIFEELEDVRKNEPLTAQAVVNKARDKTTRLHSRFEWDDSIAGEKYREKQARNIIQIYVKTYNKEIEPAKRIYVHFPEEVVEQSQYLHYTEVEKFEKLKDYDIQRGYREFLSLCDKYRHYKEMVDVINVIEKVIKEVQNG